jgi:hypothetical protein
MKGELNIPNPERRARRRILTLKNAGFAALGLAVLMVGVVLYARRHNDSSGGYGRLSTGQIAQPDVQASRPLDVITEAAAPYQSAPDPALGVPAAGDQSQGVNQALPLAPPRTAVAAQAASREIQPGDHVAIVGDDKGVSLAHTAGTAMPKLTGGFGKAPDPPVTVTDGTTRQ